jgi:hypothetical protein
VTAARALLEAADTGPLGFAEWHALRAPGADLPADLEAVRRLADAAMLALPEAEEALRSRPKVERWALHQRLHVGIQQALRHEADHLAQQIPVGGLLKDLRQCHPVVGHRFDPSVWLNPGNSNPAGRTDGPRKGPPLPLSFYTMSGDATARLTCSKQGPSSQGPCRFRPRRNPRACGP